MKKFKHLIALAAVTAFAVFLGYQTGQVAYTIGIVGLWQLSQFAMSKRSARCYTGVLTPEQVKEFDNICRELKPLGEHMPLLKELAGKDGGWTQVKGLLDTFKTEQKRVDDLTGTVGKMRKEALAVRSDSGRVKWINGQPIVTDDCAKALAGLYMVASYNKGAWNEKAFGPVETGMQKAAEFLGIEHKTALSGTEIPLPTIYIGQVVELVFAYGQARRYSTVFPLGAGTVKLPRLAAGEDDFGFLGVGTAGMSQSVSEKRATAELVTFTANKFGGLIRIPYELEEDTFIPLGQFLARYIARQVAKMEDKCLFIADGTSTYANITGIGKYCDTNTSYRLKLDTGKTKCSDITLDNIRDLRGLVSPAVLANMAANGQTAAAYYMHPTMEPLLAKLNKYPNFVVWDSQRQMLDGWPVRWIGVNAANDNTARADQYAMFFGDLSYWYLGTRGSLRVEASKEVYFATDELALRALERIDVEAMAVDAVATLTLGSASA